VSFDTEEPFSITETNGKAEVSSGSTTATTAAP